VAHAVHVDAREIFLLAESGTWVSHQPRSNMNNAVGVAPVESFLRAGIKVCMGNDGFLNAQWEEWKAAYMLHKVWNLDPRRMNGYDVVQMAIYNNAAFAGRLFGETIGVIQPGALADLIFVDYHPFTPLDAGNLPWHMLFGFHESMITTTLVAGKVLMRNGELLTLDMPEITAQAMNLSRAVWGKYQKRFA
jgi:cytosine/adenosine deaminase-related metal-dependent hydrolase